MKSRGEPPDSQHRNYGKVNLDMDKPFTEKSVKYFGNDSALTDWFHIQTLGLFLQDRIFFYKLVLNKFHVTTVSN